MTRWSPRTFGVGLALAVALVVLALLPAQRLHVTSATAPAAAMSLHLAGNAVVCDDPAEPTSCEIPGEARFTLSVAVDGLPVDEATQETAGYIGIQTQLFYGGLRYKPAAEVGDEIVWPESALPLRSPASPGGEEGIVAHADVSATMPPLPASTHTGNIVQITLTCPLEAAAFDLALLPYDAVGRPLGAGFKLADQETGAPGQTVSAKPAGERDLDLDGDPATPPETVEVAAALEIVCLGTLLPDLVVARMTVELETGGDCGFTSTALGVRVVVENIGTADAGQFAVDVNGSHQTVGGGLAQGATLSLWFDAYVFGENSAFVDAAFQVDESDEGNNELVQILPVPTLPLPCTPTPTPTPVPLPGDVDCSGVVNAIDAALILQFSAGLLPTLACQQRADVNGNGSIDSIDAFLILHFGAYPLLPLPP